MIYAQTPRLYPALLKEPWVNLFVAQALYLEAEFWLAYTDIPGKY